MKIIWILSLITVLGFIHPLISQHIAEQQHTIGTTQITLIQGDITQQKVDAIVNAANEDLSHGGGVARAISKAAGKYLQEYSNKMPMISNGERCPMGKAVITPAFDLEKIGIKKIIHATGPRGTTFNKEQLLCDAYTNSLQVAMNNDLKSIAFPAISTAIFGYDIDEATPVALKAIQAFVVKHPKSFNEIRLVVFSDKDFAVYQKYMNKLFNKNAIN
jgi:O-acetyl-ADP-ribose deacetylase